MATAVLVRNQDGQAATAANSFTYVTPPPAGPRFQALSARPECIVSLGFRSISEVWGVVNGDVTPYSVDVAFGGAKAKMGLTNGKLSVPQQLRIPIRKVSGTVICTWDDRWSPEFLKTVYGGGLVTPNVHKEFQHAFSADGSGEGVLTTEIQTEYAKGTAAVVGGVSTRLYAPYAPGFTNASSYNNIPRKGPGTGPQFLIPHSATVRYVTEFQLNRPSTDFPEWASIGGSTVAGETYHKYSEWALHPTAGPIRVFYRVPVPAGGRRGFAQWWFEVNSSSGDGTNNKQAYMWLKDFVALHYSSAPNTEADAVLMQRPT